MNLPALIFLGVLQVTSYRAVPEQTDDTPWETATSSFVTPFGVAISQDLLRLGVVCYGDVVLIEGYGLYVVNDAMGTHTYRVEPPKAQERSIDIFVMRQAHESAVGVQKRRVWVMRSPVRACSARGAVTMGMENAKKIRGLLENFQKEKGRQPTQEEFAEMLNPSLAKARK